MSLHEAAESHPSILPSFPEASLLPFRGSLCHYGVATIVPRHTLALSAAALSKSCLSWGGDLHRFVQDSELKTLLSHQTLWSVSCIAYSQQCS